MTDRQRVILSLVKWAPSTPTSTHLMKWLFLLGQESEVPALVPFYDFVPYLYGPYSFVAGRELDSLRAAGLLATEELRVPSKATAEAAADVYGRYPWYASRSVSRAAPAPSPAKPAVYTEGYEGRSADAFLNTLLQ